MRANFPQTNSNDNDKYVNDSDDGQGQGSSCSAAVPWEDAGQDLQGQEEMQEGCRRTGGFDEEGEANIRTPTDEDNDDGHVP